MAPDLRIRGFIDVWGHFGASDGGPQLDQAGALRARAERVRRKKRDLTVDAIVAARAVELAPSLVLTADKADLELLVEGFNVKVSAF